MEEQTAAEAAASGFRLLRDTLAEEFKTADDAYARQLIDCMEGENLRSLAESMWNIERIKREIAAKADADGE